MKKWNEIVLESIIKLPYYYDYFKVKDNDQEQYQQNRLFKSKIGKYIDKSIQNMDKLKKIINDYVGSKENPQIGRDVWQTIQDHAEEQWIIDGNKQYGNIDEFTYKNMIIREQYYMSALSAFVKFKMIKYYSDDEVADFYKYLIKNKIKI